MNLERTHLAKLVTVARHVVVLACLLATPLAAVGDDDTVSSGPTSGDGAVWSADTPIGPFEYRPGRGMKIGNTGLNIGGFSEIEIEKEVGESGAIALDGFNVLALYEPVDMLRGFLELEVGDVFEVDLGSGATHSDPDVIVERLYGDLIINDSINIRFGKFRTPISRRNLVPAEPFVWTTTQPEILHFTDPQQTGALLFGSYFPTKNTIKYWLYGQFIDPFDPESDENPADRSVGGRLEYASSLDTWSAATSFLASRLDGDWSYLTGLDLLTHIGPVELNSEFIYADRNGRNQYGFYLESAYEFYPTYYFVTRYEYSDPVGSDVATHLGDFGLVWTPRPYIYLKATYRIATEDPLDDGKGLKASIAVLF